MYSEAASLGSVKALNGLGYLYFYGDAVPKNESKAFQYFMAATEHSMDGDSFTNAAFCLEKGIGVEKDAIKAAQLYEIAARKFGSFGGINALGNMYMDGLGVPRSAMQALFFTTAAIGVGPWAGWLRRGFDAYMIGNTRSPISTITGKSLQTNEVALRRSLACYLYAGEFGYEVAGANAAFLLRRKFKELSFSFSNGDAMTTLDLRIPLQFRQLALSAHHGRSDAFVGIGNVFYLLASQTVDNKMIPVVSTPPPQRFGINSLSNWITSMSFLGLVPSDTNVMVSSSSLSNNEHEVDITNDMVHHYQMLSVWWYSKASASGDALGSIYSGMMMYMGIGLSQRNTLRAQRYFQLALEQHQQGAPLHRLAVMMLDIYVRFCKWWK